jgi:hypothetical protein
MRAYLRAVASGDWVPVLARMSGETFVEYDHRALAVLGTTRGAEAWVKNFSTLTDLAPDTIYRPEHFRSAARGFWCVGTWHGSREGGSYELPINAVLELDEHDRLVRSDIYDLDQADAAHARFVELQREAHESNRFANAATATVDPVIARMVAHDWPGFEQLFAEGFRMSDRRRMVQLELDRDQYVAFTREIAGGRAIRACSEIVATRGERLSLARSTFEFTDGDVGPSEVAFLILTQVDDRGRIDVYVRWDLEDLASAYAELDTRWAAHGAAEHPRAAQWLAGYLHAFAARDWTAMTALLTPDLIGQNHRLVGWGTRHGPEGVVSTLRAQIELAPDTQERVDHVRTCDGAVLFEYAWHGTREGGAFENLWLVLIELARDGRAHRAEVWEPEQLDQARARFGEIAVREARGGPSGDHAPHATRLPIMSTAAIAAMERVYRSFDAQDWNAVRAACSSRFTWEDRRPIVGMSGDVELMIASARERLASGAHHERREVIGTAGDRVAVSRILWAGGPADGRFQVEFLAVNEIDADGLCTALIFFDPEDPRVAQREAWARWAVIDPTAAELTDSLGETIDAWNAEDPERLRATFAENLVVEDHRWTGTGRSEGREAYLRTVMALWELAPGTRFEAGWTWLARAPHGGVCVGQRSGTLPDGGEFVTDFLVVSVVERGLTTRAEIFEVEAADAALARFAELHPDPLRIPPNAVTRAYDRWLRALRIRDEDAVMALYAPSYAIEDRRSLVRTSIDLDEERGNVRWLVEGDWTAARTLLATAGDRLATHRIVWSRGEAGARSEIEALHVDEVDGDGRLLRRLMFDADDRAAAGRELNHRYLGITRPSALPRYEAFGDAGRDRARLRVALPDDFFFHDHRRTGLGLLEGADAYVASVAALYELAPDATVGQPLYHLADEPQGTLSIAHSFGTLASGGAFESVYVMIMLYGSGGMVGAELFELEDLEAAKTRFEELRATRTG